MRPSQAGQQLQGEIARHRAAPNTRAYQACDVDQRCGTRMLMETTYCLLNSKEFRKMMGAEPRAKDPRIQSVLLPNEAGVETVYFVFKAETGTTNQFRTLKLQTWYDVSRTSRVMQAGEHMHSDQAKRVHQAAQSARLDQCRIDQLLRPQIAGTICTLQEYKAPAT